jgi:ADP-ribosyl-[dinitrogen reductase] hydrolase
MDQAQGPRPFPMSYWVEPGRLLAGHYPGDSDPDVARTKLRALLRAGITFFVDLTDPRDLLEPYNAALKEEAAALGIHVERHAAPICDASTPSASQLRGILDVIDAALECGHAVYVHCWGGMGRTGVVVGAWLVRHGESGDEALVSIAGSLAETPKAGRLSPETPEQRAMVREWQEHGQQSEKPMAIPLRDRFRGALLGLAAGDALGTTLEFKPPGPHDLTDMVGGGPFHLRPGEWTDDTSMALCLAASLIERRGFDPADQMDRYLRWYREGYMASNGQCFDIGNTVRSALHRYERIGDPYAGSTDPSTAGNGSIMRLAPVVLYFGRDAREAIRRAADSSRTTHGAPTAVDACRYLGGLIWGALQGEARETLLAPGYAPLPGLWQVEPLAPEIAEVAEGSFRRKAPPEIRGTGYVVQSLEAALWAFIHSDSFEQGALLAVNLGEDADTTGAVYGQLAGAYYGADGIPAAWRDKLAMRDEIVALADRLYELATAPPAVD